ncbi:hypothetical protein BCCH1_24730 [Burkholderia contaminans]|uniref:Uncharacterized protein n=1 Tax=Burkholderia contaminans TaxID=488447 RepID=A0A250L621_9BURK|nr:hypothetical protein BCCH1_24730 [Burkholderia contaminans]GLZ69187.1 hypothetical protein Bcon01_22320 [Burkholderia contaminans]
MTEIAGKVAAASLACAKEVRAPASDVAISSAWQALLLSFIVEVEAEGKRRTETHPANARNHTVNRAGEILSVK